MSFLFGGGDKPPPAPDPTKTIAAQAAANQQAAKDNFKYSAIDTYGPGGQTVYARRPDGTPISQTTTLNPTAQQTFNTQQNISKVLAGKAQDRISGITTDDFTLDGIKYNPNDYDTSQMGQFGGFGASPYDPTQYGDINAYSDQAGQAAFDHAWNYSKDAFAQDTDRLMQNLQDRGLPVGGEAYTNAVRELSNNHNRQIESMANDARTVAGQEAQRKIAMEQGLRTQANSEALTTHQQGNSDYANRLQTEQNLRNTAVNEDVLARNQNFNEATAFLTGSPALQMPNVPNAPSYNVNAPDVGGITMAGYQNQLGAYNAQQQQKGSMWNGLANLAGAAFGMF